MNPNDKLVVSESGINTPADIRFSVKVAHALSLLDQP